MFEIIYLLFIDIIFYPFGYIFLKLITLGRFRAAEKYHLIVITGFFVISCILLLTYFLRGTS